MSFLPHKTAGLAACADRHALEPIWGRQGRTTSFGIRSHHVCLRHSVWLLRWPHFGVDFCISWSEAALYVKPHTWGRTKLPPKKKPTPWWDAPGLPPPLASCSHRAWWSLKFLVVLIKDGDEEGSWEDVWSNTEMPPACFPNQEKRKGIKHIRERTRGTPQSPFLTLTPKSGKAQCFSCGGSFLFVFSVQLNIDWKMAPCSPKWTQLSLPLPTLTNKQASQGTGALQMSSRTFSFQTGQS